jgi:hypothetical protein
VLDAPGGEHIAVVAVGIHRPRGDRQRLVRRSIVNNGTVAIAAGANKSVLGLNGNTTLSGTGVVTLSTPGAGAAIINQQRPA